jgi:hypothetical protein
MALKFLAERGHRVTLYAPYIDPAFAGAATIGQTVHQVTSDLAAIDRVDVVYSQHNIPCIEVRERFPRVPIVHACLGVVPFLEKPPPAPVEIDRYLAISEEVRDALESRGVPRERISILRNMVDSGAFAPSRPMSRALSSVLVYSYKLDQRTIAAIRDACAGRGVQCREAGRPVGSVPQAQVPGLLNSADLVIASGRGVIEAMMCGRNVVVVDAHGCDGFVTPENAMELASVNFSGRLYRRQAAAEDFSRLFDHYDAALGESLRALALGMFDARARVAELDAVLESASAPASDVRLPTEVCNLLDAVRVSRQFSSSQGATRLRLLESLVNELRDLGRAALDAGNLEMAERALLAAHSARPGGRHIRFHLAKCLLEQGRHAEALPHLLALEATFTEDRLPMVPLLLERARTGLGR